MNRAEHPAPCQCGVFRVARKHQTQPVDLEAGKVPSGPFDIDLDVDSDSGLAVVKAAAVVDDTALPANAVVAAIDGEEVLQSSVSQVLSFMIAHINSMPSIDHLRENHAS